MDEINEQKITSRSVCFSFIINIYLYKEKEYFKNALANQFVTTADIEILLKIIGADLSLKNIQKVAKNEKRLEVCQISLPTSYPRMGADQLALKINDTLLLFKDGVYYGSYAKYLRD